MTDLFEKSIRTLELPAVLEKLAAKAVSDAAKERCLRLIARYKELGIDPTTKTIIFSNALDFEKALKIFQYCQGKIRCSFGIGTNLTNDTGYQPSNIVMKLSRCKMNVNQEWRECVKLSDDMGKHMGSNAEVEACLYELRLASEN